MSNDRASLDEAVQQLLRGNPRPIVRLVVAGMPWPTHAEHSSTLEEHLRPRVDGWVFREHELVDRTEAEVVIAPDGAALVIVIRWPLWLLERVPAAGAYSGFSVHWLCDEVELELGRELSREIVERADVDALQHWPRSWTATALETICAAVDDDHDLLPYGPPGWQPGATERQLAIRAVLARVDVGVRERAELLAEQLLACGTPEIKLVPPRMLARPSPWLLYARFGDEAVIDAEWDRPAGANGATKLRIQASLMQPRTGFDADIAELAPELLRVLRRRHRVFAGLPFRDVGGLT